MIITKYTNLKLVNYLKNLNKKNIFKFGNGGGKQVSGIYRSFDTNNLQNDDKYFIDIIDYNISLCKNYKINTSQNIFIEQREYNFNENDEPFESNYHMDLHDELQLPCYTFIYYYHICPTIKGGELSFLFDDNTEKIYKPEVNDLILFDGNIKHKVNKIYGYGNRSVLIMNFAKN